MRMWTCTACPHPTAGKCRTLIGSDPCATTPRAGGYGHVPPGRITRLTERNDRSTPLLARGVLRFCGGERQLSGLPQHSHLNAATYSNYRTRALHHGRRPSPVEQPLCPEARRISATLHTCATASGFAASPTAPHATPALQPSSRVLLGQIAAKPPDSIRTGPSPLRNARLLSLSTPAPAACDARELPGPRLVSSRMPSRRVLHK